MSAITEEQRKALIIAQVGEEGTLLADNIDLLFSMYGYFSDIDPNLRDLVVKRECIKLVLGAIRDSVDIHISNDSDVALNQRFQHLIQMLNNTIAEIKVFSISAATAAVSVGLLSTTAPDEPPSPYSPNANHRSYGGDPYYRTRRT